MNGPNAKRKIVCVLYDDPVDGYPPKYARDAIPTLMAYPDGQSLPSPSAIDFSPGNLLGCVSGELGLRSFLEDRGHTFVVMSDDEYLIVQGGKLAGAGAHSYSEGDATGGSDEAAQFRTAD